MSLNNTNFRHWNSFQNNKELIKIETMAECPKFEEILFLQKCENKCQADSDCRGLRKCCRYSCGSMCLYPKKTTRKVFSKFF